MEHQHHPDRLNFQIDRMIMFTDAVFAIAMTLLVMSIKVPIISDSGSDIDFLNALIKESPKFFGVILSFFLIGLYWYQHHKTFGFVINYTPKLLWLNLIFLFFVVLMPYSTSVYSEYSVNNLINLQAPYGIYVLNICCLGIADLKMRHYIFNPKNKIIEYLPAPQKLRANYRRAIALPIVFLISWIICFINPLLGRSLLFLFPLIMYLLKPKNNYSHS